MIHDSIDRGHDLTYNAIQGPNLQNAATFPTNKKHEVVKCQLGKFEWNF